MNRREFVWNALALGVVSGCRSFVGDVPVVGKASVPRLKLGVLSDIHVTEWGVNNYLPTIAYDVKTFIHALQYFRDQGVDGVVIAGDLADYGMISEMESVARAWEMVFPDSRLPDGRKVEKLFVTGNHDWEGYVYRDYGKRHFNTTDALRRAALRFNMKSEWERIWKEAYVPVWTKTVRGYTFVGAHWQGFACKDLGKVSFAGAPEAIRAAGRAADPRKPFFYIQHPQPRGTNYGTFCWGHDRGDVTAALSEFPNAFSISGHSHYPLTDDRALWQGAFTSLQMSSLRYSAAFCEDLGPGTLEDAKSVGPRSKELDSEKLMPRYPTTDGRHGSLLTVYDDRVVITRRDFLSDESLGDDWVVPFPIVGERPYAYARQAEREVTPAFESGSKVAFARDRRPDRAGRYRDVLVVRFPSAMTEDTARAQRFEIVARCDGRELSRKFVTAQGFNRARNRQPRLTECVFDLAQFTPGRDVEFSVTPIAAFGSRGRALTAMVSHS